MSGYPTIATDKPDRASMTVILGFDMETDIGSWTTSYDGLLHGTPQLLRLLAEKDVVGTFFFVGETARKHPEVVRETKSAGHEIGCHSLYHETVGRSIFPVPGTPDLLPHEVQPRLELATRYVAEASGEAPVSFRCPRLFGSTEVCGALEELGYIADASYPLYHFGERLVPYHPDQNDWTKPGSLQLIEIPNFADLTMESRDPYGRDRDQWPVFRTEGAEALAVRVNNFAGYCAGQSLPTVVCFYFHPWEFWPMPAGPIRYGGEGAMLPDAFLTEGCGDHALKQLGLLIDWLQRRGARFVTAAECAKQWSDPPPPEVATRHLG